MKFKEKIMILLSLGCHEIKHKKKVMESFRIFGLLLNKCWLVRKRHWITSLFGEIVIPISLIFCAWTLSYYYTVDTTGFDLGSEIHYERQSTDQLVDLMDDEFIKIMYAPANPFTDKLMGKVVECLNNKVSIRGLDTETEIVTNSASENSRILAVIFDESTDESTKHLHYKLRAKTMKLNSLFNSLLQYDITAYYTNGHIVQIQICLDLSYIQIKSNKSAADNPQIFIQRFPTPKHTKPRKNTRQNYILFVVGAFTIPLFVEISKATKEKFVGINVLMSINGIPNTLNLLSWIISGLSLLSILCVMTVLLLAAFPDGYSLPFLSYGNPLVLFVVFIFHLSHSLTFAVHLSAYFLKSFHLTYALIITNALAITLRFFVLEYVYFDYIPYVGIIFPILLLYEAMDEIDTYEAIGLGIQWNNLFVNAIPVRKISNTLGMIMVLSVIGTFLHFLFAIYIYAIKPGKYGIPKHPLFFLTRDTEKNENNVKSLIYDDNDNKYFEPISAEVHTPGIQIRNLEKAYDISVFCKEKVHALRGVSIDFYRGQITSILGHNGAGKSTLMSILTGVLCPTGGLILVNSKNLKDNASEILKDVGFYAQEDMYFPNLTVIEQLEFFALIKKDESRSVIESDVAFLISKLKLHNVKDCLPKNLSEDQRRKLCLGMAFVGDPNTLILDEPTSRLDYENKRVIWDILLEMRGRKTILISTHDMEEADILGDRIAILHEGRIKSCGSGLYLKKMIGGQNNIEVTLSIERWSDPDKIRNQIHPEANLVEKQDKKIIVSVPISSTLSESLDTLEEKKKDIGVKSYKLSHVGLEQVFLKVAEHCDSPTKSHKFIGNNETKLKGIALYVQSVRALFIKKFNSFLMSLTTLLVQIFAVLVTLLGISIVFTLIDYSYNTVPEVVNVQLDMYTKRYTSYTTSNNIIGNRYKNVSQSFGATSIEISDTKLDDGLLQIAEKDLYHYSNNLIAAAEFNETANGSPIANAFYSATIFFSLPISVNLLSNAIIQNLTNANFSISISHQLLSYTFRSKNVRESTELLGHVTAAVFAIPIYFAIAMFAAHPIRESTRGLKHLQRMTGVSGFTYWATMFFSDLIQYTILVVLIVIGLISVDYLLDLHLYGITEIMIMILLLMLFAINVLPLVYSFSFIKTETNFVLKLFTFIPIGIVISESLMCVWKNEYNANEEQYSNTRFIYFLIPYVSFLHGQMQFHATGILNAICRRAPNEFYEFQCENADGLCCEKNCRSRKCQKLIPYFLDSDVDSLIVSVIYLCTMPLLYFGILAVLENQLIQIMINKCKKHSVRKLSLDEQLQLEKSIILQKIQTLKKNKPSNIDRHLETETEDTPTKELFLAYELRKYYKKVRAVEDVSLKVDGCECFGLFGANRSGKSLTLKMITGQEMPDDGSMYLKDVDFKNNKKTFLSQIGYCPQYDATLKCLNAYDHLRLFSRLRGIPEEHVENEVQTWIDRLNLNAYARQPSGTLSSGNNQRLNIAMALVGNPKLVLFDEPSTRMDPGARHCFWRTIKSCQIAGQTFLLASHNIEECETLCKRTATMVDGKLLCIGTPEELKRRFGAGYDVQIRMNPLKVKNQLDRIKKDMRLLLHCVLTNENSSFLMYHVIGAGTTWKKIYEVMNKIKNKYDCIDDFLVIVRLSS